MKKTFNTSHICCIHTHATTWCTPIPRVQIKSSNTLHMLPIMQLARARLFIHPKVTSPITCTARVHQRAIAVRVNSEIIESCVGPPFKVAVLTIVPHINRVIVAHHQLQPSSATSTRARTPHARSLVYTCTIGFDMSAPATCN